MENAEGAGGAIAIVEIVKQLARLYHDGDPKWGIVPVQPKHIGELFYVFTSAAAAGDLDRFMDPSGRYGSIITLFHKYSHNVIMNSIEWGKEFSDNYKESAVEFRYAGGLFGILAAVNGRWRTPTGSASGWSSSSSISACTSPTDRSTPPAS
jgi:hypothetical protein